MGINFSRVIWCSRKLWYMTGIFHDLYRYIPRLLHVLIHCGFVTNETMKMPPQVRSSIHGYMTRRGTARDPLQSIFTEQSYMTGIYQVCSCHIFQLDASKSASAARSFRACRVSQARLDVSDLDFLRILLVLATKRPPIQGWSLPKFHDQVLTS